MPARPECPTVCLPHSTAFAYHTVTPQRTGLDLHSLSNYKPGEISSTCSHHPRSPGRRRTHRPQGNGSCTHRTPALGLGDDRDMIEDDGAMIGDDRDMIGGDRG